MAVHNSVMLSYNGDIQAFQKTTLRIYLYCFFFCCFPKFIYQQQLIIMYSHSILNSSEFCLKFHLRSLFGIMGLWTMTLNNDPDISAPLIVSIRDYLFHCVYSWLFVIGQCDAWGHKWSVWNYHTIKVINRSTCCHSLQKSM